MPGGRPAAKIVVGADFVDVFSAKDSGKAERVTAVRYGFMDWPLLSVYSSTGLPLSPFGDMPVLNNAGAP